MAEGFVWHLAEQLRKIGSAIAFHGAELPVGRVRVPPEGLPPHAALHGCGPGLVERHGRSGRLITSSTQALSTQNAVQAHRLQPSKRAVVNTHLWQLMSPEDPAHCAAVCHCRRPADQSQLSAFRLGT